ncbi:hypothetical protein FH972_002041 [Carpinus fangiana]|uniref:Uncharacterized protein n=1 Tax=Carpinus fangiana TaxID=176857 RepID=A0A5N6QG10_9ROSI|nr:hypothetical protein FH972_002041 [Carpinus fangiana]
MVGGSKTYAKGLIAIDFLDRRASYAATGHITGFGLIFLRGARRAAKPPLLFLAGASRAGR